MINTIPVAKLNSVLVTQLEALKDQAQSIYEASIGTGQRLWQDPAQLGWDGNPFSIGVTETGLNNSFDRTEANLRYSYALVKGGDPYYVPGDNLGGPDPKAPPGEGRASDCMAMQIQIDYVAMLERSQRAMFSSPIRSRMHAAIRRRGHSALNDRAAGENENGPVGGIFTSVVKWVSSTIASGYNIGPIDVFPVPPEVALVVDEASGDVNIA